MGRTKSIGEKIAGTMKDIMSIAANAADHAMKTDEGLPMVEERSAAYIPLAADGLVSGTLHAARGAVERFVANTARELGTWPAVVLTGGGADEIAPLLPGAELRADLVIEGLALWAVAAQAPDFARDAR